MLAGGRATRFGADKLAIRVGARTLLEMTLEAVSALTDLVVVAGPFSAGGAGPTLDDPAPGGPDHRPWIVRTRDPEPEGGPVVGLAVALEAAERVGARAAIVVGGDMPWLRPAILELLASGLADADAVVAVQAGSWRPLPVALGIDPGLRAARLHLAEGRRDLFGMLRRLRLATLPEAAWRPLDPAGWTFRDVDRREDLTVGGPSVRAARPTRSFGGET